MHGPLQTAIMPALFVILKFINGRQFCQISWRAIFKKRKSKVITIDLLPIRAKLLLRKSYEYEAIVNKGKLIRQSYVKTPKIDRKITINKQLVLIVKTRY